MPHDRDDWFKTAYPDFLQPLCRYLRRFVPSPEMAEDIAHDAFLRVYAAPNFEKIRSPRNYLFRTARNLALDVTKHHGVAKTAPGEKVTHLVDEHASVERQAMTAQEFDILCVAIGRLTLRRQEVLTLRTFYGFSCQEIADKLGICRRTVHGDLARALEAIHSARESIDSDNACLYKLQVIAMERDKEQQS